MNHSRQHWRLGCVSFINTKPLIWGLERDPQIQLLLDVPANLFDALEQGRCDVALLPVIDFQRRPDLRLVGGGAIGCDGPTLTVRIFSKVPIESIRRLRCDSDSHTSVALARIILAERFGIRPLLFPLPLGEGMDACLLIGDKVVCEEPKDYPYQLDLGEAWKALTDLPFVFATWMAPRSVALGDLASRLAAARRQGLAHVEEIVQQHAIPRGWPADLARRYLTDYLRFDLSLEAESPQVRAIELFHRYAHQHGILKSAPRPLRPSLNANSSL